MKQLSKLILITLQLSLCAFGAESGGEKPASPAKAAPAAVSGDEKAAIENLRKEIASIATWAKKNEEDMQVDLLLLMKLSSQIGDKMKAVKTDGVPADLKTAWSDTAAAFGEMGELLKSVSGIEKAEDISKAMGELAPKLQAVSAKVDPAVKKLEEVGKKYGLNLEEILRK